MKSSENEATGGSGGRRYVEWRGCPDSHLPIPSWGPGSNWVSHIQFQGNQRDISTFPPCLIFCELRNVLQARCEKRGKPSKGMPRELFQSQQRHKCGILRYAPSEFLLTQNASLSSPITSVLCCLPPFLFVCLTSSWRD